MNTRYSVKLKKKSRPALNFSFKFGPLAKKYVHPRFIGLPSLNTQSKKSHAVSVVIAVAVVVIVVNESVVVVVVAHIDFLVHVTK